MNSWWEIGKPLLLAYGSMVSIPRQDTFQQGFSPDCRRSRLRYGFLVTQIKAQRAAQRSVDVTLSTLRMEKLRQRMITWPALCVQLESVSPNSSCKVHLWKCILHKKKRNFKGMFSISERREVSEREKTRIPGFICKRLLAWVIHI